MQSIPFDGGVVANFLHVDVQHLWRLQAQSGFFLESKWPLGFVYPPDRIDFPHFAGPDLLNPDLIYPFEPSHLERCLKDYFFKERMQQNFDRSFYKDGKPIVHVLEIDFDQAEEEAKSSHLTPWPPNPAWQMMPDERWAERLASRDFEVPTMSVEELTEVELLKVIQAAIQPVLTLTDELIGSERIKQIVADLKSLERLRSVITDAE